MKNHLSVLAALVGLCLTAAPLAHAAGQHNGEADKLNTQITFLSPYGETTAGPTGTTFDISQYGIKYTDTSLIYAPQIWGTYPLYLIGMPMNFNVTVTNTVEHGNKPPFNIRVEALSNILNMDGSAGVPIGDQEYVVENLRPGESRTLTYSVILDNPDLFKGLNVTDIEIFHISKGKGNTDADLISQQTVYWCPPSQADLLAAGVGSTVPEPSAIVLLAIAAASLFAYAWRRRMRAA